MTPNNNTNILPWYDSVAQQNHRKDYAFGNVFCLASPDRKLLPFQIIRSTRANTIQSVLLFNIDDVQLMDITEEITGNGELSIERFTVDGYDLIINKGILPLAIETPEGQYYAKITDGVDIWYSDVFTIIRNLSEYLRIDYWDSEDFILPTGHIDYTSPYKNTVYLNTQLARPDYPFTETSDTRDGYSYNEKMVSNKTYKFVFIAPEFLCDAMRLIRMHDYVQITNKGIVYNVDSFLITPKWLDQGDLASVDAEFQCGTVIKKIGKGFIPQILGDFNADFSNDFIIES